MCIRSTDSVNYNTFIIRNIDQRKFRHRNDFFGGEQCAGMAKCQMG